MEIQLCRYRPPNQGIQQRLQSIQRPVCESCATLYPEASQSLQDLLIRSMALRYERMQFLKSQRKEPENHQELNQALSPSLEATSKDSQTDPPIIQPVNAITNRAESYLTSLSNTTSELNLSSVNTQPNTSCFRPAVETPRNFHAPSIHLDQPNYPQLPVTKGDIFTCEWCSESFTKKSLSESDWRYVEFDYLSKRR